MELQEKRGGKRKTRTTHMASQFRVAESAALKHIPKT